MPDNNNRPQLNNNHISKENMRSFLEYLSIDRTLIGPVDTGKVIEYRKAVVSDITENDSDRTENIMLMDDRVSYKSLKEYYFPQTELMFTFTDEEILDNADIPGYVIFGARPCDLEALRVMSIVYTTGKYADPFFKRRFDANLLIGVGCLQQKTGCFCEEMCVDKEYSDFCDIFLLDHGDSYTVEYLSDKGRTELQNFYGNNKTGDGSLSYTPAKIRQRTVPCLMLDVERDDAAYFDIVNWEEITRACKGCGICTYVCPTCYCFDFKDVSKKGEAKRYKCWDSCMYPKFTLHASGHNPRDKRYERYRQRVLHKYKYVPANFGGAVACTGCGRCIRSCPVGINIKDIVKQLID